MDASPTAGSTAPLPWSPPPSSAEGKLFPNTALAKLAELYQFFP